MRVLSLIDSLAPGGAERSLVEMAPHLRAGGVEVEVAVLYEREGYAAELEAAGVPLHRVETGGVPTRVRSIRALLRAQRADLLHTTLYESDVLGRLAAVTARTPVVCTLANARYTPEQYDEPSISRWKLRGHQAIDVVTARAVRRFHAVSSPVAATMGTALRVPPARIEVVPRGRDPERLGHRGTARRAAVRGRLGLDEAAPLLVTVARHEHQKGLDVLVAAVADLRTTHPNVQVLVAGREGRETAALEQAIGDAGVRDHLQLLGPRDDVADLVAAADAFVLPSRREGFPGAVVEAMALEAPLVLSDIPMMHEAVPDPSWARFVPVGDHDALAAAVRAVLADPVAAAARAAAARAHFDAELTVGAVSRRMAALFATATSSGR
jgi:glycosyltransferase involved in cell wall biosynthesis